MQHFPLSYYCIPFSSKYSSMLPFLKHPQSLFLLRERLGSHPYETMGKIVVLYIFVFTFVYSVLEY
jgi:hypothetical protein